MDGDVGQLAGGSLRAVAAECAEGYVQGGMREASAEGVVKARMVGEWQVVGGLAVLLCCRRRLCLTSALVRG